MSSMRDATFFESVFQFSMFLPGRLRGPARLLAPWGGLNNWSDQIVEFRRG
jgi:hypothetical protein